MGSVICYNTWSKNVNKKFPDKNNLYFLNSPCSEAWPHPSVSPTPPGSEYSHVICLTAFEHIINFQMSAVREVSPKSFHLVQCRVLDTIHSISRISCWLPITSTLTICVQVWVSSTGEMRDESRVHLFYFLLGSASCLEPSRLSSSVLIRQENISMVSTVVCNS